MHTTKQHMSLDNNSETVIRKAFVSLAKFNLSWVSKYILIFDRITIVKLYTPNIVQILSPTFQVPQPIGWGTSTNGLCVIDQLGAL